jgi:glycosyltransferase involved in cell wall biosynthesis
MNSSPRFSVVIPTRNCADLLKRALGSVWSQTFSNYEVLVIDNESTDSTPDILRSQKDSRLIKLCSRNHGNIAAVRNLGIQKSRGEWIAFLDSDDLWYPNKLHEIDKKISENPDVILICHNEQLVHQGVPQKVLHYGPWIPDMYDHLLFKGNCLSTSAIAVRRESLEKVKGFSEREDFVTVEDYDCWMKLARMGKFSFLDTVLGEYHRHASNESRHIKKHTDAFISVMSYHLKEYAHGGGDLKKINKRLARVWCQTSRSLLNEKMFSEAACSAKKAIQFDKLAWRAWILLFASYFKIHL